MTSVMFERNLRPTSDNFQPNFSILEEGKEEGRGETTGFQVFSNGAKP